MEAVHHFQLAKQIRNIKRVTPEVSLERIVKNIFDEYVMSMEERTRVSNLARMSEEKFNPLYEDIIKRNRKKKGYGWK